MSYKDWISDCIQFCTLVITTLSANDVTDNFIIGFGLGANLAIYATQEHEKHIKGIILVSPLIQFTKLITKSMTKSVYVICTFLIKL